MSFKVLHKELNLPVEVVEEREGGYYIIRHPTTHVLLKSPKRFYTELPADVETLQENQWEQLDLSQLSPTILFSTMDSVETQYRVNLDQREYELLRDGEALLFAELKLHDLIFGEREHILKLQSMSFQERVKNWTGQRCYPLSFPISFKTRNFIYRLAGEVVWYPVKGCYHFLKALNNGKRR